MPQPLVLGEPGKVCSGDSTLPPDVRADVADSLTDFFCNLCVAEYKAGLSKVSHLDLRTIFFLADLAKFLYHFQNVLELFLIEIGFDATENEPRQVSKTVSCTIRAREPSLGVVLRPWCGAGLRTRMKNIE